MSASLAFATEQGAERTGPTTFTLASKKLLPTSGEQGGGESRSPISHAPKVSGSLAGELRWVPPCPHTLHHTYSPISTPADGLYPIVCPPAARSFKGPVGSCVISRLKSPVEACRLSWALVWLQEKPAP